MATRSQETRRRSRSSRAKYGSDGTSPGENFSLGRADFGPPDVDDSEEDKAHYVIARYAIQNDHYTGLYRQWAKPLSFLVGKHWVTWNQRAVNWDIDDDVPEWRQQPVTNYVYAVYRSALSKLVKQQPTQEVAPPSGDSDDRESAKLGEAVLQYLWRITKQAKKWRRAVGWLLTTAQVYVEVSWDPEAGPVKPRTVLVEAPHPDIEGQTVDLEVAADENGEPYRLSDDEAKEQAPEGEAPQKALDGGKPFDTDREPESEPIGDVCVNIVDPMCVRWNPEATDEDDATEMYVAYLWPKTKVEDEFDVDIEDIQDTNQKEQEDGGRGDLLNFLSSVAAAPPDPFNTQQQIRGTAMDDVMRNRVLVLKWYAKPSRQHPKGRHYIVAGGQKVWPKETDEDYPNGEAELPFGFWPPLVPVVDTPIPGQPHGISNLSQVVPLNEQLNHLDARIGEYHTMMAMGGVIWVAPEDKQIQITSEPGQVKVSKAYGATGRHPIREKLEALPAAVYGERAVIEGKLKVVAGISDADLSQRPEGVTSGRGILALQEASDAPLMPTLQAMEEGIEEVGRRLLKVVQDCYTEDRVIRIRGERGQWEFRSFKGADLTDGLDVRVTTGSTFPWSKAAQWDSKISLITALPGLVINTATGQVDREALARYLESGPAGFEAFETDEDPDLVEVQREIAMFESYDPMDPTKSNQLPQLAFWQNHPKRLEAFYHFMKRDYGRFIRWSPTAQIAFVNHMRLTAEAVDAIAQTAANATGAAPPPTDQGDGTGATPPGGAPGGPIASPSNVGRSGLSLVPNGGKVGQQNVPSARKPTAQNTAPALNKTDFKAAGITSH